MQVTTKDTKKIDGRKNNKGTKGNKGGRPVVYPGKKVTFTSSVEESVLVSVKQKFGSIAACLRFFAKENF